MEEYICTFCLKEIKVELNSPVPNICPHCDKGFCKTCATPLSEDMAFCYGCGAVKPALNHPFSRSGSIGCALNIQRWQKKNTNTGDVLLLCRGYKTDEDKKNKKLKTWMAKRGEGMEFVFVRDLTEEELEYLS